MAECEEVLKDIEEFIGRIKVAREFADKGWIKHDTYVLVREDSLHAIQGLCERVKDVCKI